MQKELQAIRKYLGLPPETSLADIIQAVKQRRQQHPEDVELTYLYAELLRRQGNHEQATVLYHEAAKLADHQTDQRYNHLLAKISQRQYLLQIRLWLYFFAIFMIILLLYLVFDQQKQQFEEKTSQNPQQFESVQWLAKQQLNQMVRSLSGQEPSTDLNPPSADPWESIQKLLKNKITDAATYSTDGGAGDGQFFQCSAHPPQCEDGHANLPGEKREALVELMGQYILLLSDDNDCDKINTAAAELSEGLALRKSEREVKARLEAVVTSCYRDNNEYEKMAAPIERLLCTHYDPLMVSSYWEKMHGLYMLPDTNETTLRNVYQCSLEAVEYMKNVYKDPIDTAENYRGLSAQAWMYLHDLPESLKQMKTALQYADSLPEETFGALTVQGSIELDYLEILVLEESDRDEVDHLLRNINDNPTNDDSHKVISKTLQSLYYIRIGDYNAARESVAQLRQQIRRLPEFICEWDWKGTIHWLDTYDTSLSREKREILRTLISATDCNPRVDKQKSMEALERVATWLSGKFF